MSEEKIKGKVKWYSIRKGFGFITPTSDNAPTEEDIFFHQTSIVSDVKNKFLETDYEVEFEVYTDEAGKYKSKNVTKPGGDACEIPERKNNRRRGKGGKGAADGTDEDGAKAEGEDGEKDDEGEKKEDDKKEDAKKNGQNNKNNNRGHGRNNRGKDGDAERKEGESGDDAKKPAGGGGRKPRKRFDDDITIEVKNKMKEKKLDMRQTSLLLVLDKSRLKFGPDGYAALCHADGIMAEGSFACDEEGKVTLTWKNMLKFTDGDWKPEDPIANTSSGVLVGSFSWTDDNIEGLKKIETPESVWGEDKTDPADALQSNNFQMRKNFLSKAPANPRNRRRPRPRGGRKGGANNNSNGKAEDGKVEDGNTEDGKKEEGKKEDVEKEDVKKEVAKEEDVKKEDVKTEDAKTEDVKTEDAKTESGKTEEAKTEAKTENGTADEAATES